MIDRIKSRELFFNLLDLEVERAKRYQNFFSILRLKLLPLPGAEDDEGLLDCSKRVRDILPAELRGSDILSSLGNDKWAVIIPYVDLSSAALLRTRLMDSLKYCNFKNKGYTLLADLISFPKDGSNTTDLIEKI